MPENFNNLADMPPVPPTIPPVMPVAPMTPMPPTNVEGGHHSPKYAFFYLVSFATLHSIAFAVGAVIFSLIDKYLPDKVSIFSYFNGALVKGAISALIVATPLYYVSTILIRRGLLRNEVSLRIGVRRWLTYLLLFVTVMAMVGCLIVMINGLLDGELTSRFVFKTLTVFLIAGLVFIYYLYDVSRKVIIAGDPVVRAFFIGSLVLILAALVTSFFLVETPGQTRKKKIDAEIVQELSRIQDSVTEYVRQENALPKTLSDLSSLSGLSSYYKLTSEQLVNNNTGKPYIYNVVSSNINTGKYQLCTDFQTDSEKNKDIRDVGLYYDNSNFKYTVGYNCFDASVTFDSSIGSTGQGVPSIVSSNWSGCANLDTFGTCDKYCASIGKICRDTGLTSRGYVGWGTEAWGDETSCQYGLQGSGQLKCGEASDGGGARWKCNCELSNY